MFPEIAGLDGAKVAALADGGDQLKKDIAALEKSGRKLADDKNLAALAKWWEAANTTANQDKSPVNEASLYGGKTALQWTALVPTLMAIGYLLLILYFKAKGGYKQVHIEGVGKEAQEVA